MGRFLDLIFPERVYRREQRERAMQQLRQNGDQIDHANNVLLKTSAIHARHDKLTHELLGKCLARMDELDQKIEGTDRKLEIMDKKLDSKETAELLLKVLERLEKLEKKLDEKPMATMPGGVSFSQIMSEYAYGEKGDE